MKGSQLCAIGYFDVMKNSGRKGGDNDSFITKPNCNDKMSRLLY